jgi:hypothetical protein
MPHLVFKMDEIARAYYLDFTLHITRASYASFFSSAAGIFNVSPYLRALHPLTNYEFSHKKQNNPKKAKHKSRVPHKMNSTCKKSSTVSQRQFVSHFFKEACFVTFFGQKNCSKYVHLQNRHSHVH